MSSSNNIKYNDVFIEILGELAEIMQKQGDSFKSRAYQSAQETIILFKEDITNPIIQLKGLKGIGVSVLSKLNEYVETNKIDVLDRERLNPINILTNIYGIGPKKAKELIDIGIISIQNLQDNKHLLNNIQQIGLKYYDDIQQTIPREEINEYKEIIYETILNVAPEGTLCEIVGSYRRDKPVSGDIDIIITNKFNHINTFDSILNNLNHPNSIIKYILSRGKSKCLVVAQLPGKIFRRIDFLYALPEEYSFAILYFTGSKIFNTIMRQRALSYGYTLNEHGFSHMVNGIKTDKVIGNFPNEKSIFDFLEMEYKYPHERIDGRSVYTKLILPVELPVELPLELPVKLPLELPVELSEEIIKIKIKKPKNKKQTNTINTITTQDEVLLINSLIENFKMQGYISLCMLTEINLTNMLKIANDEYYCNGISIMTDAQYDILREYTLSIYPENITAQKGHASCVINLKIDKNKILLPYEMWSMDKIKPDTNALSKWLVNYNTDNYVISCKLDGVSGLYVYENDSQKLYTRGNGTIGQDISHIIPYIKVPNIKNIAIRGEFVISKQKFTEKYSADFANSRNFVAGLINKKTIDSNKLQDIDFVIYEIINYTTSLTPLQQLIFLEKENVQVVQYDVFNNISNQLLSDILIAWRNSYKYEIDGVICTYNNIYQRKTGNPEHSFAFKMILTEQIAEAKVVNVLWSPSKDGFLKPRIQIEPVILGGAKIEFTTGFNGKFINDNKIGIGAIVKIIRSGDVIPTIISVSSSAPEALMPLEYTWTESNVDIMVINKSENIIVKEKIFEVFFKTIGVEGFKSGKINKVIASGYDTIPKILQMNIEHFENIDGFAHLSSTQIYNSIHEKIEEASLLTLMVASNFARGICFKKIKSILDKVPDILTNNDSIEEKIQRIENIKGIAHLTATKFIESIPDFIEFLTTANLLSKLSNIQVIKCIDDKQHILYRKQLVITGCKQQPMRDYIESKGGEVSNNVTANTFMVITKNNSISTTKTNTALQKNITIITEELFIKNYTNIII